MSKEEGVEPPTEQRFLQTYPNYAEAALFSLCFVEMTMNPSSSPYKQQKMHAFPGKFQEHVSLQPVTSTNSQPIWVDIVLDDRSLRDL